mgnify:FL=1
MKLLVSNVGSTSLKFKLFDMPEERVLCEAKIERVGSRDAAIMSYRSHLSGARFSAEGLCIPSYAEGIALFLEKLTGGETGVIKGVEEISAIGFKTVLSRGYYGVHELTDEVMENMREYLYIAPVHNAAYIEAIGQFKAVLPDVPMIGVFETAFHREIPLERALYSIPYEWYEKYGIRKMGYHGASHGYIAQQAAKLGRAERVISCHLGGSCSICAILDGKSVDNSFGFSLQTGVMHANRAGDIDPYIVPFLMSKGMELDDILHGLSKNGGLLGVSGVSNDLRHTRGVLSMARAQAMDSAGSQFFIMHKDAPHLDGQYAAFGCVMDGMDVVDRIANQPRNMMTNKPKKDQIIAKVTVDTRGETYPEPEKLADPFRR